MRVTVAGLGVSGVSAARALAGLGAAVTVVDGGDGEPQRETAKALESEGAARSASGKGGGGRRAGGISVRLGDGTTLP
jgi:UDP-N-acetylmuramoylalanine--D-glutamate ligase